MKKLAVVLVGLTSFLLADVTYELVVPKMRCGGCAGNIKRIVDGNFTLISMDYNTTTKDVNLTLSDDADINKVLELLSNYEAKLK